MSKETELTGSTGGLETIAVVQALGGNALPIDFLRAHVEATNGEHRPQQEEMLEAVTVAIKEKKHLLAQAGTGTGKSLAYLFPLAVLGGRGVIATATNQLSEQLIRHDLPQVKASLKMADRDFSFALLKGRNNYVCREKISELESLEKQAQSSGYTQTQDLMFDLEPLDASEIHVKKAQAKKDSKDLLELISWAKTTGTGDRSDAPPVTERIWAQVSTSSADCPGAKTCPFGESCFTEGARAIAKEADIIVTNHALLATDLGVDGGILGTIFGPHESIIIDEAHSFTQTLTSSLSRELDPRGVTRFLTRAAKYIGETVEKDKNATESPIILDARQELARLEAALSAIPIGPLPELPEKVVSLLESLTAKLIYIHTLLSEEAKSATKTDKVKRAIALQVLVDQGVKISAIVASSTTVGEEQVRWVEKDRKDNTPVLYIAPIAVGDFLRKALGNRTLVGTSATLTVGGSFDPIAHTLGLDEQDSMAITLDVGSPFDYPKQGMLYVPVAPFPEPVGKDRVEHTAAVLRELTTLVRAAGGRTLALFTTTNGAIQAAQHLRNEFPGLSIYAHGDASADVLVRQFSEDETSVLCVTMGLWQGVSVEGASCSLVVIDKIAFAPVDDVLTAARRAYVDQKGRNGFNEVIVGQAATSLAQGAGRLIRTSSDKGVVAILDPRLLTKGYGRILLRSLPNFNRFSDLDKVAKALERLTGGLQENTRPTFVSKPKNSVGHSSKRKVAKRASSTRAIGKKIH